MSGIEIVTEGLRRHAGRVEAVGDEVTNARSAASQVSLQGEAYGQLCSPILVPILGVLEGAGIVAMTAAASAVDATGGALRAMATSLDIVDEIASGLVRGAGQ
jgi:hypothetical protein